MIVDIKLQPLMVSIRLNERYRTSWPVLDYLKRYLVKDKPRTQREKLLAIYRAQVQQETRTLSPAARDYIVETVSL